MKKIHLLTMMVVSFASFMLSACSSDDRTSTESDNMAVLGPLDTAANQLNANLEGLNFKDLDPLAETLASATRADGELSEFDLKLSTLLTLLKGDDAKGITLGRRFSYDAFNTALELAYDLSVILKDNGESSSSWFGLKSDGRGEVSYTARNGQQYRISAEMEKDISIYRWNFYITGTSQFYIYKDDELVLRLISNTERNRPVWLPLLIRGNSYSGELLYHDFVVTLDYRQLHTHERSVVLTYGKTDDKSPLLMMTTTLTDDADILKLIKHDVTVEAERPIGVIRPSGQQRHSNCHKTEYFLHSVISFKFDFLFRHRLVAIERNRAVGRRVDPVAASRRHRGQASGIDTRAADDLRHLPGIKRRLEYGRRGTAFQKRIADKIPSL